MRSELLITVLISVCLHETGHIAASYLCKSGIECISFTPIGITIHRSAKLTSYKNDIIIYSFGPLMSLLLLVCGILFHIDNLAFCNAGLLFLNLLPIKVFDGGKILGAILCFFVPDKSEFIIKVITGVILFFLWVCSVYILIMTSSNITLFMMCIYLFFTVYV